MKTYGDIDLQQNQLKQAVIPTEDDFPIGPKTGRIMFKNKILYICVEIADNTPIWIPLTTEINSYQFSQPTPSNVWTINHNLKTNMPAVTVYDDDNNLIMTESIKALDPDNIQITFATAQTGRASIILGNVTGTPRQEIAFNFTQKTLSDTWVVAHNLGRYPIVRVFIGNEEVQPASITHDSLNQVTVKFTSPRVGSVRCI